MSLAVERVCKRYGGVEVLRDFSLRVERPTVLMGSSGCGKTTLLRILMGLEPVDSGAVQTVERPAVVFQESRLCPQLTAVDNILLTGNGVSRGEVTAKLRELGFDAEALAQPAAHLSGGQKRRAALLRALLCQGAEALLFDEPFTGMDAELVEAAAAMTARLTGDRPAVLVTHDEKAATLLGWPVVRMEPLGSLG